MILICVNITKLLHDVLPFKLFPKTSTKPIIYNSSSHNVHNYDPRGFIVISHVTTDRGGVGYGHETVFVFNYVNHHPVADLGFVALGGGGNDNLKGSRAAKMTNLE